MAIEADDGSTVEVVMSGDDDDDATVGILYQLSLMLRQLECRIGALVRKLVHMGFFTHRLARFFYLSGRWVKLLVCREGNLD